MNVYDFIKYGMPHYDFLVEFATIHTAKHFVLLIMSDLIQHCRINTRHHSLSMPHQFLVLPDCICSINLHEKSLITEYTYTVQVITVILNSLSHLNKQSVKGYDVVWPAFRLGTKS